MIKRLYRILPLLGVFLLSLMIHAQDVPTFTVNVGEQPESNISDEFDGFRIYLHTLNVRSGPGRGFHVRGVVYDGDVLTVTGRTNFDSFRTCDGGYYANRNMWLRVDFQGVEGWVAYCLGEFHGDLNSLPIVEPAYPVGLRAVRYTTSPSWPDELGSPPNQSYIVANLRYSRVNLRETPALDGELVDILSSQSVYVIGRSINGYWLLVTYSGRSPISSQWRRGSETQIGWIAASTVFTLPAGWEDTIPIVE